MYKEQPFDYQPGSHMFLGAEPDSQRHFLLPEDAILDYEEFEGEEAWKVEELNLSGRISISPPIVRVDRNGESLENHYPPADSAIPIDVNLVSKQDPSGQGFEELRMQVLEEAMDEYGWGITPELAEVLGFCITLDVLQKQEREEDDLSRLHKRLLRNINEETQIVRDSERWVVGGRDNKPFSVDEEALTGSRLVLLSSLKSEVPHSEEEIKTALADGPFHSVSVLLAEGEEDPSIVRVSNKHDHHWRLERVKPHQLLVFLKGKDKALDGYTLTIDKPDIPYDKPNVYFVRGGHVHHEGAQQGSLDSKYRAFIPKTSRDGVGFHIRDDRPGTPEDFLARVDVVLMSDKFRRALNVQTVGPLFNKEILLFPTED